jgi:hypothetical protein
MNFTIYNIKTGKIFCSGYSSDINAQTIPEGHSLIVAKSNPSINYVKNNLILTFPKKPYENSYFDYIEEKWVLDYLNQNALIKSKKDYLLYRSDWTQIPNNSLTVEQQQAWAIYRQELRDVTSQSGYPFNVIWPTPPQG